MSGFRPHAVGRTLQPALKRKRKSRSRGTSEVWLERARLLDQPSATRVTQILAMQAEMRQLSRCTPKVGHAQPNIGRVPALFLLRLPLFRSSSFPFSSPSALSASARSSLGGPTKAEYDKSARRTNALPPSLCVCSSPALRRRLLVQRSRSQPGRRIARFLKCT